MIKSQSIAENIERVYDPEEDDYILVPKKVVPEFETEVKPQPVVPCWVCGQTFKNDIDLQTHMNQHWRENVIQDNNFNIKSSFNQKQLYITKSDDTFIEDINEPIDYILVGFKPFKSYNNKVTANCAYRRRTPDVEEGPTKAIKINFRTNEYMTKDHRQNLNQWLDHVRETYQSYGYKYEIIGISDIQLSIEKTKPSLVSYTELPPGLRSKTKAILNIRNTKFNCLRLCITAALFPAADHATRESKYFNNLVDDLEDNDNTYDYSIRLQNKNKINIWFYRPTAMLHHRPITEGEDKVEILQKCSNFVKGRKNVRILAWDEHCALIRNIEVLLERTKLNMKSIGFVIIVPSGLPLNKSMKLMNAAHKPNQRLYALN